jgi:hypothetical protein
MHFVEQGKKSNFFGLKRNSSWTNIETQIFLGDFSLTKYLFHKNSIFLGDFPSTKYLFFKNSGKTRGIFL